MRTVSVLAILIVGRSLPAQQPPTWAAAIRQYVGSERPIDKPEFGAQCSRNVVLPDSVALVNARFAENPEVWTRWPNETKGHWKALPTPPVDTFHVRVAGMACGYGRIILEHDDHFVSVAIPPNSPSDARDKSPFYVLASGAPSGPAVYASSCRPTCVDMIVTADSLVRLNAEARKEAERVEGERQLRAGAAAAKAKADAAAERTERLKRAAARKAERLKEYRALGWSEDDIALIMAGQLRIGFTARQVRESVGRPNRINTTVTAAGTHEQWVYADDYVYLSNGIVTSIQTSR